jgi:hypothetical protein
MQKSNCMSRIGLLAPMPRSARQLNGGGRQLSASDAHALAAAATLSAHPLCNLTILTLTEKCTTNLPGYKGRWQRTADDLSAIYGPNYWKMWDPRCLTAF